MDLNLKVVVCVSILIRIEFVEGYRLSPMIRRHDNTDLPSIEKNSLNTIYKSTTLISNTKVYAALKSGN